MVDPPSNNHDVSNASMSVSTSAQVTGSNGISLPLSLGARESVYGCDRDMGGEREKGRVVDLRYFFRT